MLILTLRTDSPEAEIGLYTDAMRLAYETWHAHRELSDQIHRKIETLLQSQGKTIGDLQGIACFAGPGSFTGLRIGITVADALAYGLTVPVVASQDEDWLATAIIRLRNGENDKIALPQYGAPVHITQQKK
jgi:tRNA threonylcarbamoyladenosine biosynthesis protein TsaB